MGEHVKVKLLVDLTKYAKGLTAGAEGVTVGRGGSWSRASDRFVTVSFPGIATLDVLWDSLQIIDEEVLQEQARQEEAFIESLKTAKDVVLHLGPRGGFRALSFVYKDQETGCQIHSSVGFRDKAYKIKEILESYHIPVREEIER